MRIALLIQMPRLITSCHIFQTMTHMKSLMTRFSRQNGCMKIKFYMVISSQVKMTDALIKLIDNNCLMLLTTLRKSL